MLENVQLSGLFAGYLVFLSEIAKKNQKIKKIRNSIDLYKKINFKIVLLGDLRIYQQNIQTGNIISLDS